MNAERRQMLAGLAIAVTVVCGVASAAEAYTKESFAYVTRDDGTQHLSLFKPAGPVVARNRPAVVLVHGGGWFAGSRRELYWYGKRFAEAGYVAASITYRTLPGARFPDPVDDVQAAVRWMRAHAEAHGIDPGKIAVMGNSAGGHLSLCAGIAGAHPLLADDAPVQAVVSLYGVADLTWYRDPDTFVGLFGVGPFLIDWFAGEAPVTGNEDPLSVASPINYAGPETPPVLFIHGPGDGLVPIEQAQRFHASLRAAGVPSRMIRVGQVGHAFDQLMWTTRARLFEHVLAFLSQHLGPVPQPYAPPDTVATVPPGTPSPLQPAPAAD